MKTHRLIAALLITSMTALSLPSPAQAGAAEDRVVARERLVAHGVDAAQADGRVAVLTDEEAGELARGIDTLPAGGRGGGGALLFVVVAAIVIMNAEVILAAGAILVVAAIANRNGNTGPVASSYARAEPGWPRQ